MHVETKQPHAHAQTKRDIYSNNARPSVCVFYITLSWFFPSTVAQSFVVLYFLLFFILDVVAAIFFSFLINRYGLIACSYSLAFSNMILLEIVAQFKNYNRSLLQQQLLTNKQGQIYCYPCLVLVDMSCV